MNDATQTAVLVAVLVFIGVVGFGGCVYLSVLHFASGDVLGGLVSGVVALMAATGFGSLLEVARSW